MNNLFSSYEVLTRIGSGPSALVYRGTQLGSGKAVALKMLHGPDDADTPVDLERLDPVQLGLPGSPNVVACLELCSSDDGPVLIWEMSEGISGFELPKSRRLDVLQVLSICTQFLDVLSRGESMGRPHGELKPSNVTIEERGGLPFLHILDWGLSAFRSEFTDEGLLFAAPERLAGQPVRASSELFSLGTILFYWLTGKSLGQGGDAATVAASWRKADMSLLGKMRPDLPANFIQWIQRLLELDPAQRFQTITAARAALYEKCAPQLSAAAAEARPDTAIPRAAARPVVASTPAPRPVAVAVAAAQPKATAAPVAKARAVAAPVARPAAAAPSESAQPPVKKGGVKWELILGSLVCAASLFAVLYFTVGRKKGWFEKSSAVPERSRTASAPAATVEREPSKQTAAKSPAAKSAEKKIAPLSRPTRAGLLAKEPFLYAKDAPLHDQHGGLGWTSPWNAPAAIVRKGQLIFGEKTDADKDGHAKLEISAETTLTRTYATREEVIEKEGNSVWWLSGLFIHGNLKPEPSHEFVFHGFSVGCLPKALRINFKDTGPGVKMWLSDQKSSFTHEDGGATIFVVMRYTAVPNGKDHDVTLDAWFDEKQPNPDKPMLSTTTKGVSLPKQFGIHLRKKDPPPDTTRFDEIRVGKTLEAILGQP